MLVQVKNNLSDYVGQKVSGSILINKLYAEGDTENELYSKVRFFTLNLPPLVLERTYCAYELEDSLINAPVVENDGVYYIGDLTLLGKETETDRELIRLIKEREDILFFTSLLRDKEKREEIFICLKNIFSSYSFLPLMDKVLCSKFLEQIMLIRRNETEIPYKTIRDRYNKLSERRASDEFLKKFIPDGMFYPAFEPDQELISYQEIINKFQRPYKQKATAKGFGGK